MSIFEKQRFPRVHVTRHARIRAIQRLRSTSLDAADALLRQLFERSVKLPRRLAYELMGRPVRQGKGGVDFRVGGTALLVCRGRTVITTWALSDAQVGVVLWWALTGLWSCEGGVA